MSISRPLSDLPTPFISSEGGGLYDAGNLYKTTTLNSLRIASNHADTSVGAGAENPEGGGIPNDSGVVVLTGNCIITNNTSANGGGVFNRSANATLTMDGGLVASNQAKTNGGGIFVNAGTVTVTNVTVTANNATNSDGGSLNLIYSRIATKAKGTGLGLAIFGRIIEAHRGTAKIVSGRQGGKRIIVRLPGAV